MVKYMQSPTFLNWVVRKVGNQCKRWKVDRCLTGRDADNGISDLVKISCIGVEFSESIQLNAGQQFIHWINPNEQGKNALKFKVVQPLSKQGLKCSPYQYK